jgi:hypothetical protein
LLPTFAAVGGAKPPANTMLDGFNLMPLLEGRAAPARKEMFWQYKGDKAARVGQWKWVDSARGKGLFDLAADIGEKRDLSAERPDMLRALSDRWTAWRKEMDAAEPRGPFRDY